MYFREERAFAETVHDSAKRGGIIERYGSPHNPLKRPLDGGNNQKGNLRSGNARTNFV